MNRGRKNDEGYGKSIRFAVPLLLYKEPQAKPVGKRRSGSDEAENKDLLLLK